MIDRNHPAVDAARRALAADDENGCMIEQHEGNGMWTCLAHGVSADGPDMCWYVRDMPPIVLNAAREHYTADDLRATRAGQALIREGIAAARTDVPWLLEQVGLRDKALEAVLELHKDGGESQGYLDDGSYGDMPHCCTECGSLGEYGVPYPCPTVTAITTALNGDAA